MADFKPTIQTTAGYTQKNGVKCMVYGKAGVGKTPLAATMSRPLILAAEDGLGTVAHANIPFIRITTRQDLKNYQAWLSDARNLANYDWIVLDSLSNLTQVIFTEIMKSMPTCKEPRKFYGELTDCIVPFLQTLFGLAKNVMVIAWQGDENTPAGAFVRHLPVTKGQAIANYCMHFFDMTLHMALHQVQQTQLDGSVQTVTLPYLQTREFNYIFARDRTGKLDNFEPADMTQLLNKLTR